MMKYLLIIAIFITSTLFADILYINMNDSKAYQTTGVTYHEITGIRKAARARNERVVIIPPKGSQINKHSLKTYLKQYANNGKISSVVISGHNGNGNFGGTMGNFTADHFEEVMNDPALDKLSSSVQGLYLWGCYTNVPAATGHWRRNFKNLKILSGFDGQSPINPDPKNTKLLEDMLKEQATLARDTTPESQIKSLLEKMNNPGKSYPLTLAMSKVCESGKTDDMSYYQIKGGKYSEIDLKALMAICNKPETKSKIQHIFKVIKCYRHAHNKHCETPPRLKHSSDLRDAYNDYQSLIHCIEHDWNAYPDAEKPESLIRLIYFKDMFANFKRIFKGQLSKAAAAIGSGDKNGDGVPDNAFLKNPNISRRDFILGVRNAYNHLMPHIQLKKDGETAEQAKQRFERDKQSLTSKEKAHYDTVMGLIKTSNRYIYWTDPTCVPLSNWTPSCGWGG